MDLRRGDAGHQAHQQRTAGPAQGAGITLPAVGTRLLSPDSTLVAGWDRAILHAEAMAQRAIALTRAGIEDAETTAMLAGVHAATALLGAGRREPARALIRLLSRAAVSGSLPDGLGVAACVLVDGFRHWAGDAEFLEKYPLADGGGGRAAVGETAGAGREATGDTSFALIDQIVSAIWGLEAHAESEQLGITLCPPAGAGEMALTGLRIGRTTLAMRYRVRPGQVILRCDLTRGPGLRLSATLSETAQVTRVSLDDVAMGGGRVVWRAAGEHEVVFELDA